MDGRVDGSHLRYVDPQEQKHKELVSWAKTLVVN